MLVSTIVATLIPMQFAIPDFTPAIPEIFLLVGTCLVLLVDLFLKDSNRYVTYLLSQIVLLTTAVLVISGMNDVNMAEALQTTGKASLTTFSDMFVLDPMSQVLKVSILLITVGVFVYSRPYLKTRQMYKGEYFTLGLFAVLGMMIMVSAKTMLIIYLGLELLSLAMYAMVAFRRNDGRASEAGMKYFVLGAIASGMLLYGMSIIYGVTGSLHLDHIDNFMMGHDVMKNMGLLLGLSFILVGLGFKLGVVPFHMWVPDVYDGSPTAVTLFLGTAPKIAAFAMMFRLLVEGLDEMLLGWQQILSLLAALSLFIGNIIAIAQTNIKRMLAYSTISHMGFVLLGILAGTEVGYASSMFYIITYSIVAMGAFGIIILLSRDGYEADRLIDLQGLSTRHPWYAFMMMLFLFSMAGVPPTVGFYAKLSVLKAVVGAEVVWLAVFAVVMSVIGAYYYLRAIKLMYFDQPDEFVGDEELLVPAKSGFDFKLLLSVNGLSVLALGILPGALMSLCVLAVEASL
ncbi:NADH-quinone oxidoreductase subunit NuoN [uncultured Cocleimonas sp.]|uniref:NADH-quinone oxidoreductase subunit NuoN n=1 Tax=uncultured Cocleimonas sp. TaxID=1051587 RepID=UPI00262E4415|nr:NADH-quinone oxidoreductase subunit NuoN [uncultured Cocleimonas sp.]